MQQQSSSSSVVTIGVPAHNEAGAIHRIMTGLLDEIVFVRKTKNYSFDLVVATNGCTDGTEGLVEKFAVAQSLPFMQLKADAPRDSQAELAEGPQAVRIVLLSIPEKGKARAWNAIYESARGEFTCFFDADVVISEGAVLNLLTELEEAPDLFAAACDIQPLLECRSLVHCYLYLEERIVRSYLRRKISGGGYMLRKDSDFPIKLPMDLIAEDAYLTVRISTTDNLRYEKGPGKLVRTHRALVLHAPPKTLRSYYAASFRAILGTCQVDHLLGAAHKTIKQDIKSTREQNPGAVPLRSQERVAHFLLGVLIGPIVKFLRRKARRKAKRLAALMFDLPKLWQISR